MKEYRFYGWQTADVAPVTKEYEKIENPRHLYDLLSDIWCADTCAPRMRDGWTKENMTLGQCSITSFLVQDIFGGEVYGIPLEDGSFHCYNKIGTAVFDLTSEQFKEKLEYKLENQQFREVNFASKEKEERYLYLKKELEKEILKKD